MRTRFLVVAALLISIALLSLSFPSTPRPIVAARSAAGKTPTPTRTKAPTVTDTPADTATATSAPTMTETPSQTATHTPPPAATSTPAAAPGSANYLPLLINPGAVTPTATPTTGPSPTVTPSPSPTTTPGSQIPHFSHVFIIVLENHEYSSVIGNSAAPYFNSLAQQYGLATNSYAIRHPSLPNYLALTAGSTFTVTNDCTKCFINAPNVVDQLETAGKSWKAYMEGMPSPCFVGDSGIYRQKHNPFIYYDDIRTNSARCNRIVPFSQFQTDLNSTVPAYTWITPDMCNDEHDCGVDIGDAWLRTWVPQILASPAWQNGGVLFITYDEGSTRAGCCTVAAGGHIATLVISPLGKPAYQSPVAYDHYSLLRTIEDAWGMPALNDAGCACTTAMVDFFAPAP